MERRDDESGRPGRATAPVFRLPVSLCVAALLLLLPLLPGRALGDELDRDLEPRPPWRFFEVPDEETAREIATIVNNSLDSEKILAAREALVRRFGVWSVPKLVLDIRTQDNEPRTWNAALTAYALRDRTGNARELWPLVQPLVDLLGSAPEPYRRAFAALALGSFHGTAFQPDLPVRSDPLIVPIPEQVVRKALAESIAMLGRNVDHGHIHVRVAVALALGKSGDAGARARLTARERLGVDAAVEPRMAVLLAVGLLPEADDERLLRRELADEERKIRRAAALGVALQALGEEAPGWSQSPERLLRALKGDMVKAHLEDGAEAVFARGVLAGVGLAPGEWDEIFAVAITPSTEEEAARAAAQCLLFCEEPWFAGLVAERLGGGSSGSQELKDTVLAAFLLSLGARGLPDGVEACSRYLKSSARSPRGEAAWDVRYHAALGLLRALADGHLEDAELHEQAMEALEAGVARGMKPGAFRDALQRLLETEGRRLTADRFYRLPRGWLDEMEAAFDDPHGLLARDLRDVAVTRLNDMVPIVFGVNNRKPGPLGERDNSEQPRRFLQSCHERYPYFSRVDLRTERGRRSVRDMPAGDDPLEEVRRR